MTVVNKYSHTFGPNSVYIGRGSMWGNPFVIGKHGDRDAVCEQYEDYLVKQIAEGKITKELLASLHGKDLVCYCAPKRCHGHTLERYAAEAAKELENQAKAHASEFKLIVAGGRDFNDRERLVKEIHRLADELEAKGYAVSIVSGMARGADKLAYYFARNNGVQVYEFPADWDTHGKRAGYVRNEQMANFSDGLLAFWDGSSKGTKHMIGTMKKLGKSTRVIRY